MLKAKEDEVERLRGQQRQLSAGGTEQWHSILENTNAKCRLLERENSEWKARDEKTARRWTELQDQSAAYAARVGELETLLQRQRDSAGEISPRCRNQTLETLKYCYSARGMIRVRSRSQNLNQTLGILKYCCSARWVPQG